MGTKLKIYWDGDAPGLNEHKLSLAAFGRPLWQLLHALRGIAAAQMAGDVHSDELRRGRLPRMAEMFDLQITSMEEGSLALEVDCTLQPRHGESLPLFSNVERAVDELMVSLEQESQGIPRHKRVRRFLDSLPGGVRQQRYTQWRNGQQVRAVEIGEVVLAQTGQAPRLLELEGEVTGLGFEPGRAEVRLLSGERRYTCAATSEQVEKALSLRGEPVRAMLLLRGQRSVRLLWIRRASERTPELSLKEEVDRVAAQWDEALRELAK